jgi:hypothetical protein
MGFVLMFVRTHLPALGAPIFILLGGAVGGVVFLCTWLLLPGGGHELASLVGDVRSALRRKIAPSTVVAPRPIVNPAAPSLP